MEHLFADGGYLGPGVAQVTVVALEIFSRPPGQKGFVLQKRRWVVERTFAWVRRCRRLSQDYEGHTSNSLGFLILATAMILLRRKTGL